MQTLPAVGRLARLLAHALAGWFTIVAVFPRLAQAEREARVQAWAGRCLRILGIELRISGEPPERGPLLLVANHISWLDILVIHAARHCRFVSKADIRRWPVVGTLAAGAGTLFIERDSRRDAMRVVHRMADSLKAGDIVAVFPEGTTGEGLSLLPFHANLLQAAISALAPVQPVGLRYLDAATRQPSLAPAYVGDDTLAASVWRVLSAPPIVAAVRYGEWEAAQGRDRRAWAAGLHARVDALRQAEDAPG